MSQTTAPMLVGTPLDPTVQFIWDYIAYLPAITLIIMAIISFGFAIDGDEDRKFSAPIRTVSLNIPFAMSVCFAVVAIAWVASPPITA